MGVKDARRRGILRSVLERSRIYYGPPATASAVILAVYAVLLGLFVRANGLSMFQNLSQGGRTFLIMQGVLVLTILATSLPLASRWFTPLAIPRLILALFLLAAFLYTASVSDGFRY